MTGFKWLIVPNFWAEWKKDYSGKNVELMADLIFILGKLTCDNAASHTVNLFE